MPKHGWKYRTEKLRALPREHLYRLHDPVTEIAMTSKMARWVYCNLLTDTDPKGFAIDLLQRIAEGGTPWARSFLIREFEKHRKDSFGDWVIVCFTSPLADWADVPWLIAAYEDGENHPMSRGSVIYTLNELASCRPRGRAWEVFEERIRATCARALLDPNPYARAGACWLARNLGGFEEDLERLADDRAEIEEGSGITVGSHVY